MNLIKGRRRGSQWATACLLPTPQPDLLSLCENVESPFLRSRPPRLKRCVRFSPHFLTESRCLLDRVLCLVGYLARSDLMRFYCRIFKHC